MSIVRIPVGVWRSRRRRVVIASRVGLGACSADITVVMLAIDLFKDLSTH